MEKKTKRINKRKYNPSEANEELKIVKDGRIRGLSDAAVNKLAEQLTKWANQDDALVIGDFVRGRDFYQAEFYDWCNKFPVLRAAKEEALALIANRRERGALTNSLNANFVATTMALYSKEFRALAEWRAKLARQEHDKSGDKIIVVERFHDAPKSEEPK